MVLMLLLLRAVTSKPYGFVVASSSHTVTVNKPTDSAVSSSLHAVAFEPYCFVVVSYLRAVTVKQYCFVAASLSYAVTVTRHNKKHHTNTNTTYVTTRKNKQFSITRSHC